ncbi:MAG: ABC transporter ATP-binding protein [Deltaproteobacteria bacterium]|nr:ABC transporter ATP-binding protein [Deltaproteobacteria bacterium]
MALLAVHDLSKQFRGLRALHQVSLAIEAQEIVGVIGPNGSGKTTLFEVISGFLRPTSGRVVFDGRRIDGLTPERIARLGVGRTFQIVEPFLDLTLSETVQVGLLFGTRHRRSGRALQAEAQALLARVGLGEKAKGPARHLSLGELKRLELARALSIHPRLLLLDELLAGLSPQAVSEVIALLRQVRQAGCAILIIDHTPRLLAGVADRLIVLAHGAKLAEGPPEAVLQQRDVAEAYMGESG